MVMTSKPTVSRFTRQGLLYLSLCGLLTLALWSIGVPPLVMLVAVGGSVLCLLVGIASGLYIDDLEGA